MMNATKAVGVATTFLAPRFGERRRTVVALVSASIISLVVWGLILVLKIQ